MCHKHHCLLCKHLLDALVKDVVGRVVVDGREGVVKEDQVATKIGTPGQVQALPLPTREVDATEARLGLVPVGQDLEIHLEGTGMDGGGVVLLVKRLAKHDVVTQAGVLAPGNLGDV